MRNKRRNERQHPVIQVSAILQHALEYEDVSVVENQRTREETRDIPNLIAGMESLASELVSHILSFVTMSNGAVGEVLAVSCVCRLWYEVIFRLPLKITN